MMQEERPSCPDCGQEMVKTRRQLEDGSWMTFWLCGCETPEYVKAEAGRIRKEAMRELDA